LKEGDDWLPVRYAVGQPMGAYSSFAMLALTHHVIVQVAAKRAGYSDWFTNYALLGDDIVIGDIKVGVYYYEIMHTTLGVDINVSKSLESDIGVLEFAKRLYRDGEDLTPLSPKVLLLSIRNIFHLPDLILDMVTKSFEVNSSSLLALTRRPRLLNGASGYNVYKAVWSCFSPFGVIKQSPIPFQEIGSIAEVLPFFIRDFIYQKNDKAYNSTFRDSRQAQKAWQELREKERGGLPGSLISQLPSTKLLDMFFKKSSIPVLSLDDTINSLIDIEPDVEIDLETWLPEQVDKLVRPSVAIIDIPNPMDLNKSRGQLVFDF